MVILVADSGSTKTDWALFEERGSEKKTPCLFHTEGINPSLMEEAGIADVLRGQLLPQLSLVLDLLYLDGIFFYGAGVRPDMEKKMRSVLEMVFTRNDGSMPHVEAHSDLLGAARALCGNGDGIACILGTGANSCLYRGGQIVENTPALGFILGDEGGGASLGKRFLNALFKGLLPHAMKTDYLAETHQTLDEIIRKVYREPMANRFLASTSLYISRHIDDPLLRELVKDNFRQFFSHNLLPYDRKDLDVGVVGSIGYHYAELLREAAREEGFSIGTVLKSPVERLCSYHLDFMSESFH